MIVIREELKPKGFRMPEEIDETIRTFKDKNLQKVLEASANLISIGADK